MAEPAKYTLEHRVVELHTGGGDSRWTLTGWDGDDEYPGYLDKPTASLEDAQRWAEDIIWRDSHWNTKVAGWDGCTPRLQHYDHKLEIFSTDGGTETVQNVATGVEASVKLGSLADPNAVWVFTNAEGATYIPVRNITYVRHIRTPVEQPL